MCGGSTRTATLTPWTWETSFGTTLRISLVESSRLNVIPGSNGQARTGFCLELTRSTGLNHHPLGVIEEPTGHFPSFITLNCVLGQCLLLFLAEPGCDKRGLLWRNSATKGLVYRPTPRSDKAARHPWRAPLPSPRIGSKRSEWKSRNTPTGRCRSTPTIPARIKLCPEQVAAAPPTGPGPHRAARTLGEVLNAFLKRYPSTRS